MAYETEQHELENEVGKGGESERAARVYRDIDAYVHKNGKDLEEAHLALAQSDEEKEKIGNLWHKGRRTRLTLVAGRFDALRPKIEEAKRKLAEVEAKQKVAKPSAQPTGSWRRTTETNFFGPALQPAAEPSPKDNTARKALAAKIVEANRSGVPKRQPDEEEPEPVEPDKEPDEEAATVEALVAKTDLVQAGTSLALGNRALNRLLTAMNDRHAVIGNIGGKCRVLEWVPSDLDENALQPMFQSKTDFINRYANRQVGWTRKGDPLTAGAWWFEHPSRADYRGVVFKPGKLAVINHRESGSWLNLWRGWGILPEKGRWPLLRNHVEQILSGGDPKMADYTIRWAAWGFQNPGDLSEAALVLRGKKGGGKGIYLGTLRRIYGPHGLQITHASHLTGNFNAHLWTCAYLFADEAFWAGDKQGEAVLKGLITERPMMTEKKGIDIIMSANCVKLAISGNSDWVVPASHDERRYAVSDIDNRYAKTVAPEEVRKTYFDPIYKEIAEGGAAAMLYDLLKMPLGDWHPREVPMTTGLMRQKKQSLRGNFQWLEPLLQSGTLPAYCGRPNRILTADLLAYVKTFRGLEYASEESIASFLYDEMRFIPDLSPEGNKFRSKGVGRGWEFSPLLEMREHWETLYGGEWNWHDTEIDEWQGGLG